MRRKRSRMQHRMMAAILAIVMVISNLQIVPALSLTALAAENESEISASEENTQIIEADTTEPQAPAASEEEDVLGAEDPEASEEGDTTGAEDPEAPEGGVTEPEDPEAPESGVTDPEGPGASEPGNPGKPENSPMVATATVKIHFKNTAGWEEVYGYCADHTGTAWGTPNPGWPGKQLTPDTGNPLNYTLTVEAKDISSGLHVSLIITRARRRQI